MLLCIGGVCVPYTAVVPLLALALKWIAVQLAQMGLLPKAVANLLNVNVSATSENDDKAQPITALGPSVVEVLSSEEQFRKLVDVPNQKVVCKFTASWCKPCHKIQPIYEILSSHYPTQAKFLTIDVDQFDEIASQFNVAMMPTFLVLEGSNVLGKYNGSNEKELQRFMKEQLGRSD